MTRRPLFSIVVALAMSSPEATRAQGPAARDYLNTPVNQARFFVDFLASNGETADSSDIPLPNSVTISRYAFFTLLWSFPLRGRYGGVQVGGGYARVKFNGPLTSAQTWGFTDPSITFHANFFGAPAVRLEDFRKTIPQTYSSFHLTINPPLGSYDRNSSVNTGANRWAFTPVVNLDITPDKGVSWIDLYAGARFVTDNNEFRGNNVLSQNPLGVLTAHYSHNIGKRMWAGIGVHYDNGGRSFVNHIPLHDYANGIRPAIIVGRRFGKISVGLRYENTASKPDAAPTNGLLSFRVGGPLYPFF
jgi:Putative MetA-pathway of phenol degradation